MDPIKSSDFEMTIDVQTPPGGQAVVRTWAIETLLGDEQTEYFNNIQLTFAADQEQAGNLVAKAGTISRDDIRQLLQAPTTKLTRITISNETGGDGKRQTHGQRYDVEGDELAQHQHDNEITEALDTVFQKLKKSRG
jgi:hypothetical protein